jgi:hypothetical protein
MVSRSMAAAKAVERERIAAMTPLARAALALALGRRLERLREAQSVNQLRRRAAEFGLEAELERAMDDR